MRRHLAAALGGLALPLIAAAWPAGPAGASTMPTLELTRGHAAVAVGVLDANLDVGLTDRLAVGATLTNVASWYGALRATYRMSEGLPGASAAWGWTVAGGFGTLVTYPSFYPGVWLQPAVTTATPFWTGSPLTLRFSLGPVLYVYPTERPIYDQNAQGESVARLDAQGNVLYQRYLESSLIPLWPNLELACRVAPHHEITLLGNSLVGWRGTF